MVSSRTIILARSAKQALPGALPLAYRAVTLRNCEVPNRSPTLTSRDGQRFVGRNRCLEVVIGPEPRWSRLNWTWRSGQPLRDRRGSVTLVSGFVGRTPLLSHCRGSLTV